jgi:hypothetical protein
LLGKLFSKRYLSITLVQINIITLEMKIYKYTPHIDDFLKSSSLRVSPAYELNDPFEVVLSEKTIKKRDRLLNKLANRMGLNIELGRQLRQLRENAAKMRCR